MASLLIVILIIFLVASVAYAMGYEVEKKAGEYQAEVKTDRNPPVIGDNNIEIEIDKGGRMRCEYFRWQSLIVKDALG